jgi:hypothetical protein
VGFDREVVLDGSRSSHADAFEWRQVAGPKVELANADHAVPAR